MRVDISLLPQVLWLARGPAGRVVVVVVGGSGANSALPAGVEKAFHKALIHVQRESACNSGFITNIIRLTGILYGPVFSFFCTGRNWGIVGEEKLLTCAGPASANSAETVSTDK